MQNTHSTEPAASLQALHDHRQNKHPRRCHYNSRDDDLSDAVGRCQARLADHVAVLVFDVDSVLQLVLTHQRNVDAVGNCHGGERSEPLEERTPILLQQRFVAKRRKESCSRRRNVCGTQLICRDRRVSVAVRVVHNRVEGLIDELPEDDSRNGSGNAKRLSSLISCEGLLTCKTAALHR